MDCQKTVLVNLVTTAIAWVAGRAAALVVAVEAPGEDSCLQPAIKSEAAASDTTSDGNLFIVLFIVPARCSTAMALVEHVPDKFIFQDLLARE